METMDKNPGKVFMVSRFYGDREHPKILQHIVGASLNKTKKSRCNLMQRLL